MYHLINEQLVENIGNFDDKMMTAVTMDEFLYQPLTHKIVMWHLTNEPLVENIGDFDVSS